jgi:hypothetical protein
MVSKRQMTTTMTVMMTMIMIMIMMEVIIFKQPRLAQCFTY